MKDKIYIAIDLKSFYASVECVERNLDPLHTNLVVADIERTAKTICLAVSPSLKAYGIPGRARLFEVIQKVKAENQNRLLRCGKTAFTGKSADERELSTKKDWEIDYIVAPPRMAFYIAYSSKIYDIYLRYIAPEDIHIYSIDEVFMDVTPYLKTYKMDATQLATKIVHEVYEQTKITATAGIGTNLYLAKVAMDIVAKHMEPDETGARCAMLDEISYRKLLWNHRPLTDFWRVGQGYRRKLEENGLFTMGDIARCSVGKSDAFYNEDLLYKMFGINAELLIDHAWGWEPCTIADIKAYKPAVNSTGTGMVLQCPYSFEQALMVVKEITDMLVLDLVEKGLVTDQMVLTIGYDTDNLQDSQTAKKYTGKVTVDRYGRNVPKPAHGTINLQKHTSSTKRIMEAVVSLYNQIVDPNLMVRRINITANHVIAENQAAQKETYEQLDLFTDYAKRKEEQEEEQREELREKNMQQAVIQVKNRYGKNALLRGSDLKEGAMTKARNGQIGGHKA